MTREATLLVDLGNSRIRFARLDGDGSPAAPLSDEPVSSLEDAALAEARFDASGFARTVVASVAPKRHDALARALRRLGAAEPVYLTPESGILAHRLETPRTTGVDRLLAARGAWEILHAATLVVDAGTAVTVDALDREGVFLGGAILPGPGAWLEVLSASADQIPALTPEAASALPATIGDSTEQALRAGLVHGLAGAVDRLLDRQREELGERATVLLTGGAAPFLAPALRHSFRPVADLLWRGMAAVVRDAD
jgi:type III pantothenate kinase